MTSLSFSIFAISVLFRIVNYHTYLLFMKMLTLHFCYYRLIETRTSDISVHLLSSFRKWLSVYVYWHWHYSSNVTLNYGFWFSFNPFALAVAKKWKMRSPVSKRLQQAKKKWLLSNLFILYIINFNDMLKRKTNIIHDYIKHLQLFVIRNRAYIPIFLVYNYIITEVTRSHLKIYLFWRPIILY